VPRPLHAVLGLAALVALAAPVRAADGPAASPLTGPSSAPPPGTRWSWQRVPVWRDVELPVCERRAVPTHSIRFVPRYEVVVEPVYGVRRVPVLRRETDSRTGAVRDVPCGFREERVVVRERRHRRLLGYDPVEVPTGCRWETTEVRRETKKVLAGWRWERVASPGSGTTPAGP